ncbi:hypothetical protein BaRGS_00020952 [Batillaria attramentaria]|uniref:Secreted protein n=1 Tax=Batillaria attramentaria TaxID=370345 RepID=A0ABD0KKR2_9CAEN
MSLATLFGGICLKGWPVSSVCLQVGILACGQHIIVSGDACQHVVSRVYTYSAVNLFSLVIPSPEWLRDRTCSRQHVSPGRWTLWPLSSEPSSSFVFDRAHVTAGSRVWHDEHYAD